MGKEVGKKQEVCIFATEYARSSVKLSYFCL